MTEQSGAGEAVGAAIGSVDDDVLVRRALDRPGSPASRRAAGELLERYRRPVYLWCFRHVREHEHALDMAQEVLLRAYEQLHTFQGRARFSSWLFSITRNRCLNEMRRVELLDEVDAMPDALASGDTSPLDQVEERERQELLLAMFSATLEGDEQRAMWLRCVERIPVDEITAILGIETSSGARGLLQSARRKLRKALERPEWKDLK